MRVPVLEGKNQEFELFLICNHLHPIPLPQGYFQGSAMEFVETGVVTHASKDYSIVEVPIDNTGREFTFGKKLLYAFGKKCDRPMCNILEQGIEVNVLYKLGLNQTPTIIAVWLDNNPDYLDDESTLKPIFDQPGRLKEVNDNHFIVECDEFKENVLIMKSVLLDDRDGYLLDEETEPCLEVGDSVTFDAVPLKGGLEVANYTATCAWFGVQNPRLVDRFGLAADQDGDKSKEDFLSRGRYVEGIVTIVLNDDVAFVDVDSVTCKVLLFRSCFKSNHSVASKSLKDLVAAGDALCLTIRRGWMYSGRRQWFATKAWKCDEHTANKIQVCCETSVAKPSDVRIEARDVLRESHANDLDNCVDRITVNNSHEFTQSSTALLNDPPLCVCISRLSSDSASISFRNLKIYVQMSDVYVDGSLCTAEQFNELVSSGEREVRFEAIQSPPDIKQKHGYTLFASCVWIGEKPSLAVIASAFDPPDFSLLEDGDRTFIGEVFKFSLPKIALIRLKREATIVFLHLSDYLKYLGEVAVLNATITDLIKVGDYFEFNIRRWSNCLNAVESRRSSRKALEELIKMEKDVACNNSNTTTNLFVAVPKVHNSVLLKPLNSESENLALLSVKNENTAKECEGVRGVCFKRDPNFTGRLLLLHCHGALLSESYTNQDGEMRESFLVKHALGSSSFIDAPVVYDSNENKYITPKTIRSSWDIWFDAVVIDDACDKLRFQVERLWFKQSGRQTPETFLRNELFYKGENVLAPSILYRGTINSIPLYDSAIVTVSQIPVLVTLQSLVTDAGVNESYDSNDLFLKIGDEVLLTAVKEGDYYRAEKCWSLCADETRPNSENKISSDAISMLLIESWKSHDYYATGFVWRLENGYYVKFTTPKRQQSSKTLLLNLFTSDKVFVDGKFIRFNKADCILGRKISFYVAYSLEKEMKSTAPYGLYVAYAWAGNWSVPWAELDGRVSVPRGVLRWNRSIEIEAVVECLPGTTNRRGVPQHIVCSIGPLPVLVPNDTDYGAQNRLRKGKRVYLRVQEKTHITKSALVSKDMEGIRSYTNVLRLKGKVETSPDPVGMIKTVGGVQVCFDLFHVQDKARFGCDGKELSSWLKRVSEATHVGATVYFTAVKGTRRNSPYRALMVWPVKA